MMRRMASRAVYVVSDLHLGGAFSQGGEDRGFRMMTRPDVLARFVSDLAARARGGEATELVINGDFVDFLAEEHDPPASWRPFLEDPDEAARTLRTIVARDGDRDVFRALGDFVGAGGRLVVMLGNHDLELCLPASRRVLVETLGSSSFTFLYDGEGYPVARNALIEHGNRYDPANIVDHDGLRRVRSLHSRRDTAREAGFSPPAGSRLVAEVMNPIKARYAFIDLLKPESEPLIALLLALEPDLRGKLARIAKGMAKAVPRLPTWNDQPVFTSEISSVAEPSEEAALDEVLRRVRARLPAADEDVNPYAQDVGSTSDWVISKLGVLRMLVNGDTTSVMERVPMIRQALRALHGDASFDDESEAGKRYLRAARALGERWPYVIFGHTHHAKHVKLDGGATYLNSGTWANLMRFPEAVLAGDRRAADDAIWRFLEDLRENHLSRYVEFRPTFVRLAIDGDEVKSAEVDEMAFSR